MNPLRVLVGQTSPPVSGEMHLYDKRSETVLGCKTNRNIFSNGFNGFEIQAVAAKYCMGLGGESSSYSSG
jgi:hypothetical protein